MSRHWSFVLHPCTIWLQPDSPEYRAQKVNSVRGQFTAVQKGSLQLAMHVSVPRKAQLPPLGQQLPPAHI